MNVNLIFAWTWVLAGISTGFLLGLKFWVDGWLGGYTSLKRRLLRLGHIAFFGMAILNFMYYFTVTQNGLSGGGITLASWGFMIGGVMMPLCCFLMVVNIKMKVLFAIPVIALLISTLLTLKKVWNL